MIVVAVLLTLNLLVLSLWTVRGQSMARGSQGSFRRRAPESPASPPRRFDPSSGMAVVIPFKAATRTEALRRAVAQHPSGQHH